LALDLASAARAEAVEVICPRIIGTDRCPPQAGIAVDVRRLGSGDTLAIQCSSFFDWPLKTARWNIALPAGLAFLNGTLERSDVAVGPSERHGAYAYSGVDHASVRCEHWGDFEVWAHLHAAEDSLNWSGGSFCLLVHVTQESLTVNKYPFPFGHVRRRTVVDGVHYREQNFMLIPLDPGEDEEVAPGLASAANLQSAPVIHKEAAARAYATVSDSTIEVRVWVAVDREGRVKAVRPYDPNPEPGIPADAKAAALDAAQKWTFTPAQSLGRPVSMLYLIRVPVATIPRK
jgi:hypothetical protein